MTAQLFSVVWTSERVESLTRLHKLGLSATLISRRLNAEYGTQFTRNAIIGAAHRAGLPKRPSKERAGTLAIERRRDHGGGIVYSIARRQVTGSKPLQKQKISASVFLGIKLLDLKDGQCRFPRGDKPSILFCGQPQQEGSPYCAHCHSIAHEVRNAG